jgi:hypothetical protein
MSYLNSKKKVGGFQIEKKHNLSRRNPSKRSSKRPSKFSFFNLRKSRARYINGGKTKRRFKI